MNYSKIDIFFNKPHKNILLISSGSIPNMQGTLEHAKIYILHINLFITKQKSATNGMCSEKCIYMQDIYFKCVQDYPTTDKYIPNILQCVNHPVCSRLSHLTIQHYDSTGIINLKRAGHLAKYFKILRNIFLLISRVFSWFTNSFP